MKKLLLILVLLLLPLQMLGAATIESTDTATRYALSFDGGDDYVDCGNAQSGGFSLGSNARSIELWFKTNDLPGANLRNMAGYGTNATSANLSFASIYSSKFYFWGHNADVSGVTTLSVGVWYHGVITFDGTTVKVYLNGAFENSNATSLNTKDSQVYIGKNSGAEYINPFNGLIDEVRIYNRALGAAEVLQHYQGIFLDETGLVGHWAMDEGSGTTANDTSGNGNNGTLTNGPAWALGGVPPRIQGVSSITF